MAVTRYVLPSPEGVARLSIYIADTVGELPTSVTMGDLAFTKDTKELHRCTVSNSTWASTGVAKEGQIPFVALSSEVTF